MNETIIVFGFIESDGTEQVFLTLDESIAVKRADRYRLTVVARRYEFKESRVLGHPFYNDGDWEFLLRDA